MYRDVPRIIVDLSLRSRLLLTLYYVLMLLMGYCIMLLVMTFNYPILLMVVAGMTMGHFLFEIIGLPKLPMQYKQIAGSGAYMPECDNCCSKLQEDSSSNPSAHRGYEQAAQLVMSNEMD